MISPKLQTLASGCLTSWFAFRLAGSLAVLASVAGCAAVPAGPLPVATAVTPVRASGPKVLVVVAHPDDEILFAGLLYKLRTHLDGAADVFVITNGEGGFKYATLAESIYGHELTDESVGRARLPEIRASELRAGCELLGVRDLFFLREQDHRYTQDVQEVLGPDAGVWDLARIRGALAQLIRQRSYDFVLMLPPTTQTHGHHQAASLLTLEVLSELAEDTRPIPLCARTSSEEDPWPTAPSDRAAFPLANLRAGSGPFIFDRRQPFGHRDRLDYTIVVNWAIAEHRSQGTMQRLIGRGLAEHYFLFDLAPAGAEAKVSALFERLAEPQFPKREYAASAGTNAGTKAPQTP